MYDEPLSHVELTSGPWGSALVMFFLAAWAGWCVGYPWPWRWWPLARAVWQLVVSGDHDACEQLELCAMHPLIVFLFCFGLCLWFESPWPMLIGAPFMALVLALLAVSFMLAFCDHSREQRWESERKDRGRRGGGGRR